MHISHFSKASKATARFVQFYLQRETRLGATTLIHPVPARAAHMLNFQFGGPVEVRLYGTEITRPAETAAIIGPRRRWLNLGDSIAGGKTGRDDADRPNGQAARCRPSPVL